MRRFLHPLRLLARAVTLAWLWRNRHDIVRWAKFVARTAANRQELDKDQIMAEVRARAALTMDPRTRIAPDLDIEQAGNGLVVVRTHVGKPTAQVARDVLERVSGVETVDIVDPASPVEQTTPASRAVATSSSATGASSNVNGS
jgi:hypothetical protein